FVSLEIGNQYLDTAVRLAHARLANDSGENRGAAVGEIVPIDRCDDHVTEIQCVDGAGHAHRLHFVDRARPPMGDGTIRARARADVAENHERGGAVMPALADVRTLRLFADRVQVEVAHQALDTQIAGRPRGADF